MLGCSITDSLTRCENPSFENVVAMTDIESQEHASPPAANNERRRSYGADKIFWIAVIAVVLIAVIGAAMA